MTSATTIIIGPIFTSESKNRAWKKAVATRGGQIVFVGSEEDLEKNGMIRKDTKIIRLSGNQIVIPGFQDGHVHPLAGGIRESRCSLEQAHSWTEAIEIIHLYKQNNPGNTWITGSGWHWKWFESQHDGKPHAKLLDEIIHDRPMVFRSYDGHNAICNTAALRHAGLHEDIVTVHHCDHHIERHHETRFPTGLLHDDAMPLIYKLLPPLTLSQKLKGLSHAIKKLYAHGITSFQDAMVRKANLAIWLAAYSVVPNKEIEEELAQIGTLPRVSLCLLWELETGFGKDEAMKHIEYFVQTRELVKKSGKAEMIRANTIKVMLDGTLESQTAFLHTPYLNTGEITHGEAAYTKEELSFMFTELDKRGFQIHVHAIGDAALTYALDAFESCRQQNPAGNDNRHHIAHLQVVHANDIKRFEQLNVVANFQPYWFLVDHDKHKIHPHIGPERYDNQYPILSVMETGAKVAFGSDYPFGSLCPIAGIHTAVNHFHPDASMKKGILPPIREDAEFCREYELFRPEQRIKIDDAIHLYTMGAAYVNYSETFSGSIEVGKMADMIVLSDNIFEMDQSEISNVKVSLTMANGTIVYERNN